MFAPLLADDISTLISAIIVIVGFLGWIFNLVTGKNQPVQPPPRPKPRRTEVHEDIFIQDEPARKPSRKKSKPTGQPPQPQGGRRPVTEINQRHLQTSNLGSGVRSQVSDFAAKKIDAPQLTGRVEQSVTDHLGAFTGHSQPADAGESTTPSQHVLQLLRNRNSVRQAMIVNTILERPRFRG